MVGYLESRESTDSGKVGSVVNFMNFSNTPSSGDSWMYPYQRTPMGNPYISPIYPYIAGVYGLLSPRIPK